MNDNGSKLTLIKNKTDDLDNFTFGQSNKMSPSHNLVSMLYREYIVMLVARITLVNDTNIWLA